MKSKSGQKSHAVTAAALVLALGAAVYLNWSYGAENAAPQTVSQLTDTAAVETSVQPDDAQTVGLVDPLLGEEEAVSAQAGDIQETANKNYGEAQLVSVNKDTGTEFFEQARLSRTKARDEALDSLKKTLKSSNLTTEEKQTLTNSLNGQINSITLETSLETLIKAKGFADCVVTLNGTKANVTVMTENDALTSDEVTRIRDVLLGKCQGMKAQDITVVEVK